MKRRQANEQQVSHIAPVTDDDLLHDGSEVREEIGATIAALMPWGISILAHVGLIVIAFFLVWQTIVNEPDQQPHAPALSTAQELTALTSDIPEPTEELSSSEATFSVEISPVDPIEIKTIGNDYSAPQLFQGDLLGDLTGPFKGPKTGTKPPGQIFGDTDADTIVFLIDASGSMVDVLPFVINELKEVVSELKPRKTKDGLVPKRVSVIFFSGDGVHEVPGGGGVKGLREATLKFKNDIRQWVSLDSFNFDVGGRGSAHVKSALTRALSYKPQLVILLSDNLTGGGQGATQHELMQDDLLELIHEHNKARPPAKINTIQFLYEDPLVHAGLKGTLKRIAEETGGVSNFVGQEDLNLR